MNQRERFLAAVLLGLLACGGGALAFHAIFLRPLNALREDTATLREDVRKKQEELKAEQAVIERAEALSPRLTAWKQLSLPESKDARPEEVYRHLSALQVDYERYLSDLLRRNGFAPGTISVVPRPLEAPRTGRAADKAGPPPYRALTFSVQGQAPLDNVATMLEEFHRGNVLQQIRSFTIQLKQQAGQATGKGLLDLAMTVEAILVTGAEKRPTLLPESLPERPRVLAEPARGYAELAGHNVFTGTPPTAPSSKPQSEDPRDVLSFIKLTTISNNNGRRWEAWLFDQAKKDGESRLRASTGFNEFSYADRYDNLLIKGVVLRIDETGVLFRANGRFCRIGVGDNLYDASQEALNETPLPAAGAAIGATWAAPW